MVPRSLTCLSVLLLAACNVNHVAIGPSQHESKSFELDKSELVRAELKMAAGELQISGGAAKLMEGDFIYNVPEWKPEVRYSGSGFRGNLTIEQNATGTTTGEAQNEWTLRFNDGMPLDLNLKLGAGEAKLNLGTLSLRSVDVQMGAGELRMDLRGTPKRDYDVRIRGGVGEAIVRLPRDIGIRADATGGIGSVNVRGLTKVDDHYENDVYDHAKVRIRLDVKGGIGNITLDAE